MVSGSQDPTRTAAFDHTDSSVPAAAVRQLYKDMLQHCPIAHSERYGGFDYVNRYDDVRGALHDNARFSSADGIFIPQNGFPKIPALEDDPPDHTVLRQLMEGPLNPRAVRAFGPTIQQIVDYLIDHFVARGSADLASEFCDPLPAIAICRVMGLDQGEAGDVRQLGMTLFTSIGTETFDAAWQEFSNFIDGQLQLRTRAPRDDYLTKLAQGNVGGVAIDSDLVTRIMTAFLVGGHHSTSTGIAGTLRHILAYPGLAAEVTESDSTLGRAIEESLRLTTPLQLFARTVYSDTTIGDVQFTRGDRLMLNIGAANRDEDQFPNPDAFDIDRARKPHLAFGAGIHYCVGQHLARAEIRIGVRTLLRRLPDLHLVGPVVEAGLTGGTLMAITSLPVEFTPGLRSCLND
ncbi:cytochrome P450 [Mycobacterium montefiorense]|uniref:Cytochrome P450 YjiB n=1 Tax=Mycobacterium montefiorense TaxID=154654 RepID=A0AA37V4F4_9MYCO|nr:cytochrome P450 [Mycobacterium montefiorense]GBG39423.1 putative cytochrome P450 YjiB [Mycobacterium montefiorense]GKU33200.1 putative cytochrome P450 YjiB [Mycobacterium montefiorense]GKU42235.1 putative cytochrome P450 YjiB [Mycobacterium montefiorense]GKU44167.1 putative cytochrome P450 YjiB [Mycobacterium montefiorense]GKU53160.1 putative cytochrome P450 YjiB [Mycobacterium montefiorense]